MPNWGGLILTDRGKNLQAKVEAGTKLNFTKIKFGDGAISGSQTLEKLIDLVSPRQNVVISSVEAKDSGICEITSVLSNSGVTQGYYLKEMGVFATDPDIGEIMFAVSADTAPDYLVAGGGSVVISEAFSINLIVSNTANITAVIDPKGLVTVGTMNLAIKTHNDDSNAHASAIKKHNDDKAAHAAAIGEHDKNSDAHVATITKHNNDANAHATVINKHNNDNNAHSNRFNSHNSDAAAHANRFNTHDNDANAHAAAIAKHNNDYSAHSIAMNFWQKSRAYALDDIIHPKVHGTPFFMVCTQAGNSGTSEPVWVFTEGTIVSDGGVMWQLRKQGNGSGKALGDIYYSMLLSPPEGSVRVDGTEYTQALFPDVYKALEEGLLPTLTYTQWQDKFAAVGNVGEFALDIVAKKFKVPLIDSSTFISQALANEVGSFVAAGLPNATGEFDYSALQCGSAIGVFNYAGNSYSALQINAGTVSVTRSMTSLDLSKADPIYGNSNTVTPNHIRYPLYVVVANTAVPTSLAQYDAFIGALSLKANADFSNVVLNSRFLNNIRVAMSPDYTAGVALIVSTSKQTVSSNGYLYFRCLYTNSGRSVIINDVDFQSSGSATNHRDTILIPVSIGDIYRVNIIDGITLKFFPTRSVM